MFITDPPLHSSQVSVRLWSVCAWSNVFILLSTLSVGNRSTFFIPWLPEVVSPRSFKHFDPLTWPHSTLASCQCWRCSSKWRWRREWKQIIPAHNASVPNGRWQSFQMATACTVELHDPCKVLKKKSTRGSHTAMMIGHRLMQGRSVRNKWVGGRKGGKVHDYSVFAHLLSIDVQFPKSCRRITFRHQILPHLISSMICKTWNWIWLLDTCKNLTMGYWVCMCVPPCVCVWEGENW